MDASPRRTRAQRKAVLTEESGHSTRNQDASVNTTARQFTGLSLNLKPTEDTAIQSLRTSLETLPEKLTAKGLELSPSDLKTVLKKQKWLRTYTISLTDDDASLRPIVDATLVFGQEEAGTAICISGDGLLLTCSHCVAETEAELDLDKKHVLLFASGKVVRAKFMAWDGKRDLALLQIVEAQGPSDILFPSIAVAARPPKSRDPLVCVGHPGSEDLETILPGIKTNYDTLHVSTGVFRGYVKGQDLQDNSEIGALKHDCWTYWGHSGAPLASRVSGQLIGLHSSWDDSTGMRRGIPVGAIREFLREHSVLDDSEK